jgi:hypothetical protein
MIPPKSHPKYRQLVTGELSPEFKLFAFSMCVSRNKRFVEHEGKTSASIAIAIDDVYAFLEKYERTVETDLKSIFE